MGLLTFVIIVLLLWWWLLGRDPQIQESIRRDGRKADGTVLFAATLKGRHQESAFATLVGYKFTTQYAKTIYAISLLWDEQSEALKKGDVIQIEYSARFPFQFNQPVGRGSPR